MFSKRLKLFDLTAYVFVAVICITALLMLLRGEWGLQLILSAIDNLVDVMPFGELVTDVYYGALNDSISIKVMESLSATGFFKNFLKASALIILFYLVDLFADYKLNQYCKSHVVNIFNNPFKRKVQKYIFIFVGYVFSSLIMNKLLDFAADELFSRSVAGMTAMTVVLTTFFAVSVAVLRFAHGDSLAVSVRYVLVKWLFLFFDVIIYVSVFVVISAFLRQGAELAALIALLAAVLIFALEKTVFNLITS